MAELWTSGVQTTAKPKFLRILVEDGPDIELELGAEATGLIVVLEALNLHAMTKKESETLHEMLESVRIDIEQKWADWDS